ncbi:cysteine hydrolase family protein [Paenibacillus provencensis]|uniref:Cysteine hydrolase family protein n=1 Tax=Paenibacillus provencensis TaxID=441151 RepID=A0ABW3PUE7_9BACL|nr:cysteine hydrolase family protein [Paenibacillus sp. MER 78]MCM3127449.1 cysteine hydrolase [Paenibacillus sp. MER 78]
MTSSTALMIIDVQNAMFSYPDLSLHNGEQVLSNIQRLLQKAREDGLPVIYIQHTSQTDDEYSEGTPTWYIHPSIAPQPNEWVVRKSSWDAFYQTELLAKLQKLNIQKLVICGMQTEFCLDTTSRCAYSLGYHHNVLVSDAHSTFDSKVLPAADIIKHHNQMLGGRFVQLIKTEDILAEGFN